jgi:hypothetical protein
MSGVDKMLDAVGEDKFQRFNRLLHDLADELVKEGTCKGYKIEFAGGTDVAGLSLDARPLYFDELSQDTHRAIAKRYFDLMYSCGITGEEFDKTEGGVDWIMNSRRRSSNG